VLAQPYHPGPFEAGIFYYRHPHQPAGRIFSITDKKFSELTGNGRSTIEQLIWRHPRYRMQARTFLRRHASQLDRVLAAGERFTLVVAGNHCQGAMFCDGAHLITLALEQRIDQIARTFEGEFFFGRFDIRYTDASKLKAGEAFTIIELNGVTSESTNIYDPTKSLACAYRTLARQWRLLFAIGSENRKLGHTPTPWRILLDAILSHSQGFA
jgi:hypothetical protein